MKLAGGRLVAAALEDEGAAVVFGIPGTHNIGFYEALAGAKTRVVLATDERCAAFMADGLARAGGGAGVLSLVPGAGLTHALSGICEAWLDQVPMVVLCCRVRSDTGRAFQLHDVDQTALLRPVTKAVLRPSDASDLYPAVRRAFSIARAAPPGPVAVEVPAELYLLAQEAVPPERRAVAPEPPAQPDPAAVEEAARLLNASQRPFLYAGNGCRSAAPELKRLAERLQAPVTTTIQGKGVFPERHPLWLWNVPGEAAPPFARAELAQADAMLAIGCRFAEVATASYALRPPETLIHVDADPSVFDRNFKARLAVRSDAAAFIEALLPKLRAREADAALEERLARGHAAARRSRAAGEGRVSPAALLDALDGAAPGAVWTADSGNGLFLAMERLRLDRPGRFLAPVDYSCMGYSVPAAIGAKLAEPSADVVALVGDGAFLMTGLSLVTAAAERAPVLACVLRDGELGQIAQFQRLAFGRAPASTLPDYRVAELAAGAGAKHVKADSEGSVGAAVAEALKAVRSGRSAVLEAAIDTSRATYFTRGAVRANFARLPFGDRLRLISRRFLRALGA